MIDIHSHILPGIDDGAEDMYETLEMAKMAVESGVTAMVATPHCNLPGLYDNYFSDAYVRLYQDCVRALKEEQIPLVLYPGVEVYATHDLPEMIVDHKVMPLNQSRYILMEFAFDEDPDFASLLLQRVSAVGARPVIAHAERYEFIQDYPQIAYQWRKRGYIIQVNKGSILGRFGRNALRCAQQMLSHNLVSVMASDAHSPFRRTPYLQDAYEVVCEQYSKKIADLLFQHNPARICKNQPILRLEPIPFSDYEV